MADLTETLGLDLYWPLDNLKTSDDSGYERAVDCLVAEMRESCSGIPDAGSNLSKLRDHVKVIVCNLHCAGYTMPSMFISFRRALTAYKADPSYRGFQFSYKNVRRVTDFLQASGYIEMFKGYPGSEQYRARLSKMRATPKLLDLLENRCGADPASIYQDTTHLETVIIKGTRPRKRRGQKIKPPRKVVKTPDKPAVRTIRDNLKIINRAIRQSRIELDMDLHELEQLYLRLAADPEKHYRLVDFTNKSLYRVFSDRSLDRHGRFYGGWWQGIPEEAREKILINGMLTVELDYKSIHPYILYGIEGVKPRQKDLYKLQEMDEDASRLHKPVVKKFLLIMLNAGSEAGAIRALAKAYGDAVAKAADRRESVYLPPFKINAGNLRPIIEQLRRQHEPIAHYFFRDCGNMLMNEDSQLAEQVLLHFAGKGMACLPIHDSFVVDVRFAGECWDVMRQAFSRRFGQKIPVDLVDGLERAKRILSGPRALQQGKAWHSLAADLTREIKADDPNETH